MYAGQRCFIIGNGPSINRQDLLPLRDEHVIASNQFFVHPQSKAIKPEFHCVSDFYYLNHGEGRAELRSLVLQLKDSQLFLPARFYASPWFFMNLRRRRNIFYIPFHHQKRVWESKSFSADLVKGVNYGHTVIIDFCLPLAHYLGFSEVFLLGCDMNYDSDGETSHFWGEDIGDVRNQAGNISRSEWYDVVSASYEVTKEFFASDNRAIYDATLDGRLTVFHKSPLESLFSGT